MSLVNGRHFLSVEESDDWKSWWSILFQEDLDAGQNAIEFRNRANRDRSSSFSRWQLKDVRLWKPFGAKPIAGATFLGTAPVLETALGDPFPTPSNAGVTLPFTTAAPGQVRISVFNLNGAAGPRPSRRLDRSRGRTRPTGTGAPQPERKRLPASIGRRSGPESSRNRPGWC